MLESTNEKRSFIILIFKVLNVTENPQWNNHA